MLGLHILDKNIIIKMKAISYRMTDDIGHAPCVFDSMQDLAETTKRNYWKKGSNLLTLSCCARNVRRMAEKDDLVLGIAGAIFQKKENRLIWIGRVDSILSKREYAIRYPNRPDSYYYDENGIYVMDDNAFHDATNQESDLNPANTLLFKEFYYFGENAMCVTKNLVAKHYPCYINETKAHGFFERLQESHKSFGVYGVPNDLEANRDAIIDWVG